MRTIVHLSDMHFGKFDEAHTIPLLAAIHKINPHLVIISGDLTQRARLREYAQAKAFLNELKHPYLVIPGNHDIHPFYKPLRRITEPYSRYKHYISKNLEPTYVDNEIVVASITTVRATTIKDGWVNPFHVQRVVNFLNEHDDGQLKIMVTHHPLALPRIIELPLARLAKSAVRAFSGAGVDMYLSGHLHHSSAVQTAERHKIDGYSAIAVQAGTVSVRLRNIDNELEGQSFNVIIVNKPYVTIARHLWNPEKNIFRETSKTKFACTKKGFWEKKSQ